MKRNTKRQLAECPGKTVLAVFAHPDDEVAVGPLLAHYARRHVPVHLVFVTSGQKGVREHAGIPAGEKLGAVREREAKNACKVYGIGEPYFLREQDGSLSSMQRHKVIVRRLSRIIQQVRPAAIITWGPEGLTGHPDHRAVSNLVTEILQKRQGVRGETDPKLYYVAYPKSRFSKPGPPFLRPVGSVDESLITTVIRAKDGLSAAVRAQKCYRSQHTPQVMRNITTMLAEVLEGNICLRLALPQIPRAAEVEHDLFSSRETSGKGAGATRNGHPGLQGSRWGARGRRVGHPRSRNNSDSASL